MPVVWQGTYLNTSLIKDPRRLLGMPMSWRQAANFLYNLDRDGRFEMHIARGRGEHSRVF
jgi:hypothetical protein